VGWLFYLGAWKKAGRSSSVNIAHLVNNKKQLDIKFEWDENKNRKNLEKHKINFEEAKTIFDDPDAIEMEADHNGEYRIIRIGKTATKFILLVVYTLRDLVVRLISARQANKDERNLYIEQKFKNHGDESSKG
jgi:uncharacterized protein